MECSDNIDDELAGIDLGLFQTEAVLYRHSLTADAYGGRTEAWAAAADTIMVGFFEDRPGLPGRIGERKEPVGAPPYVVYYPIDLPAPPLRIRDRWRIAGFDYEVMEILDVGQWAFFHTTYCAKVDQYEPAS